MLWLQIRLKSRPLYIGCLYRPPDEKVQYWNVLDDTLEGLEGEELVLMGDLNVDTMSNSDTNRPHLNKICAPLQLKNLVSFPTRFSPTSQRSIDVILSNSVLLNSSVVEHMDFTDHALVYSAVKMYLPPSQPRVSTTRRLSKGTAPLLGDALHRQGINNFQEQDLNSMWKEWSSKIYCSVG